MSRDSRNSILTKKAITPTMLGLKNSNINESKSSIDSHRMKALHSNSNQRSATLDKSFQGFKDILPQDMDKSQIDEMMEVKSEGLFDETAFDTYDLLKTRIKKKGGR